MMEYPWLNEGYAFVMYGEVASAKESVRHYMQESTCDLHVTRDQMNESILSRGMAMLYKHAAECEDNDILEMYRA